MFINYRAKITLLNSVLLNSVQKMYYNYIQVQLGDKHNNKQERLINSDNSTQQNNMNKLDLIFEKEPPEVQRKLMNLLIQYNAMMQYNPREDKFEVDLLLPFQTAQQKHEFIENFKSRQHKRSRSIQAIHQQPQYATHNKSGILSEQQKRSQQLQRTMQKNNRKNDNQQKQNKQEQGQFGSQRQKDREREKEREDEQFSYQLTNENYDMSMRRQTVSIRDVSAIIKTNLQNAVKILAEFNRDNSIKGKQGQIKYETAQQNFNSSSIKLNRVQIDGQIQHENSNPMILSGLEEITHKNNENLDYMHDNQGSINGREKFLGDNLPYQHRHQDLSSYNSSETNNKILIDDDNIHENDQQMNTEWNNKRQENGLKMPQQSKLQQPAQTIEKKQFQNNLSSQRERIQQQKQMKQKEQQNSKHIKQKLSQKYKKVNSSSIRQKYSDFLKKNHRDFSRIYETIRKQIKRNQSKLVKSRKQDPILVLEENISDTFSEQDRIFKEEVIKDYQRHIIAENQNMSSQDLIRYFRYLLQNAKNLYIKQLRKTK